MKAGRLFAVVLAVALGLPASAIGQESAADLIQVIEGRQEPNRQGFDGFTLEEIMDRVGVPGVSVAVIMGYSR